ncbi:MAG: YHYH domain-containing protein [Saccharofermentanales bacterium]
MKKLITISFAVIFVLVFSLSVYAHSGRTDSSGGHRDTKNVSGLGSYHYHHGYGPHLHPGGICPYDLAIEEPISTPTLLPTITETPTPTLTLTPTSTPTPTPIPTINPTEPITTIISDNSAADSDGNAASKILVPAGIISMFGFFAYRFMKKKI